MAVAVKHGGDHGELVNHREAMRMILANNELVIYIYI